MTSSKPRTFALTALVLAALLGCGAQDPARQIEKARADLADGNSKAAVIAMKSLLQEGADSGEARFVLGKALFTSGDTVAAKVEMDKAAKLGYAADLVTPAIAHMQLLSGDLESLVATYGQTRLGTPAANAGLRTTLALAYSALGQFDRARESAEAALKADPDHVAALVLSARLKADGGDLPGALAESDRLIASKPGDPESWQLRGDLLALGKQDIKSALVAYDKASSLDRNYMHAHVAIMSAHLAPDGDVDAAKAHLTIMSKAMPNNGMTRYFEAYVALRTGDTARAQEIAQLLLSIAPDNPRVLQLASLTEFTRGTYARAASLSAQQLQLQPQDDFSRRLLAASQLKMGQPERALTVVKSLLDRPRPDAAGYKLAAQAQLQLGNTAEAVRNFERAAKLDPKDTGSRAAIAYSRVDKGDVRGGIAELQALAADDDGTSADLPLVATLINARDFDKALTAIAAYEEKSPTNPLPVFLRGRVLIAQGDKAAGRAAYERALKLRPTYYLAANALAELDLSDGKPAEARRHFDDLLKADPRHVPAMVAIARLKARAGASNADVAADLSAAIQVEPTEVLPRLALIELWLATRDVKAALQAAQQANASIPDHPQVVEALGNAQAASGDTNQAVLTYNKLIQLRPNTVEPYLRLADALWAAGKRSASTEATKRALLLEPDNLMAKRALFNAYVAMNQPDDALAVARDAQKRRPTEDVGFLMEGSIPASKRKWDQALQVYRAGLKAAPASAALAERVHVVLSAAGRDSEAAQHAEAWLKAHPKDAALAMHLGDLAVTKGDLDQARSRYREVLRRTPDNPLALNNLAWLLVERGDAEALSLAERANQLLPNRPVLMETLARALAAQGQVGKGVTILRDALRLEPGNPMLRLNLAKLLIQAGDKSAAKTELDALAELGAKFPRQSEVGQLMKTL